MGKEPLETSTASAASSAIVPVNSNKPQSWPEDIDREATGCGLGRWAIRVYNNWTYSFMNPILKLGAQQNKALAKQEKKKKATRGEDNDDEDEDDRLHLTSDDLYSVPRQ